MIGEVVVVAFADVEGESPLGCNDNIHDQVLRAPIDRRGLVI
jgi:hypothetical protein